MLRDGASALICPFILKRKLLLCSLPFNSVLIELLQYYPSAHEILSEIPLSVLSDKFTSEVTDDIVNHRSPFLL